MASLLSVIATKIPTDVILFEIMPLLSYATQLGFNKMSRRRVEYMCTRIQMWYRRKRFHTSDLDFILSHRARRYYLVKYPLHHLLRYPEFIAHKTRRADVKEWNEKNLPCFEKRNIRMVQRMFVECNIFAEEFAFVGW